jgi:AraC-like DNA-binding protein
VSVQEYRLRRLINQSLHYRNFNQFLNHYRIEEAARRLLDPAEEHIPISSIALDVGYASLSSFNKAFKDTHGVTPSTWRASDQATASVLPHSDESRL